MKKLFVGIIMGSDFDFFVMKEAVKVLEDFGIEYEIIIVFVYRIFERMFKYVKEVEVWGIEVIIVGVGGAVYFSGMVVLILFLLVIGVLVKIFFLNGLDFFMLIV